MKIVTTEQMRVLERRSVEHGVSLDDLMENAGLAVAQEMTDWISSAQATRILVLIGPGNNGGDGLVAARHLQDWGAQVTLYLCTDKSGPPDKLEACQRLRMPMIRATSDTGQETLRQELAIANLVLDAVLGTGSLRPTQGMLKSVFTVLNEVHSRRPDLTLISLDLPSGLQADTGEVDTVCPYADATVTLGAPKLGLFQLPGAKHVGRLIIADIGIPVGLETNIDLDLLDSKTVSALLPRRPMDGHKGTFGHVLVVAGSRNFVGASSLASMAAYRTGAGLVTLATPESVYRLLAPQTQEVTFLPLPETADGIVSPAGIEIVLRALPSMDALLVGCGLSQTDSSRRFVSDLLLSQSLPVPCVLDADALNNLATTHQWWKRLNAHAVLTPHPGEMGRLVEHSVDELQKERVNVSKDAARRWGQVVTLKGAFTIIASPTGSTRLNPNANPALGSGGTGDVLSGMIVGLMAQGLSPYDAASCGVYLHSLAGSAWSNRNGNSGLLASDLLSEIPQVMKALREEITRP
jgi:hydroxyethylthiazole kinase-like uncharacterized protein yjeF